MTDKYNLTLEQNIFLAKKLITDSIYNSAKLEGCNVTFPDTQTILDGMSVPNIKISDIECVLNLRDAWNFLLKNLEQPFDLGFACKINSFVSRNESLEKLATSKMSRTKRFDIFFGVCVVNYSGTVTSEPVLYAQTRFSL